MAERFQRRNLSFEVLTWHLSSSSSSDDEDSLSLSRSLSRNLPLPNGVVSDPKRRAKRRNKNKKKRRGGIENCAISEDQVANYGGVEEKKRGGIENTVIYEDRVANYNGVAAATENKKRGGIGRIAISEDQAANYGGVTENKKRGGIGRIAISEDQVANYGGVTENKKRGGIERIAISEDQVANYGGVTENKKRGGIGNDAISEDQVANYGGVTEKERGGIENCAIYEDRVADYGVEKERGGIENCAIYEDRVGDYGVEKERGGIENCAISEDHVANYGGVTGGSSVTVCEEVFAVREGCVVRQRNVAVAEEEREGGKGLEPKGSGGGGGFGGKLETVESLDWKKLMAHDPNHAFVVEKSPLKYFMEEMYNGNSLQSTTTLGSDKERERVYDTIFRLPWRCELLINVGFFVCLDSFLSMLTIMPTRIFLAFWRLLKRRQFERPSAEELSDVGCFIILSCGVALLEQTDISLIYHMIRGQGTIKLYVVYNVLEIFDRLCQNFGGDVLQTLFSSAEGLANSSPETMRHWLFRFISDEILAVASSIIHSFVLLAQAITLSTCIVAHNNALLALLVSNNFAEIKSNVFKRYSKDNIHSLVYFDSIERFHISAFLIFVLAQNILEAEGPWFESFLTNALLVYVCEMMIDIIKHSFIAKFNDIKPIAYSEFLEDLCKQTLNMETENGKKNLTFVPLAPACVVIRVLSPIYAAHLPYSPLPWRLFWILLLFAMTFIMLASLKVMICMGLKKHAKWYINRCQKRKLHTD